jgi:alpha-tubulin suppressor-like RCC1 family protein
MSLKILFSGLNVQKQIIDKFSFEFNEQNLNNILTSFDSILYFNKNLSYFNFDEKKFHKIHFLNEIQTVSTNTDHVWLLNNDYNRLVELSSPFNMINRSINLDIGYNADQDGDILICSTDINVYLLCNKSLKCVYQLENENFDTKDETKINESPVLAIPLNKKFFNEKIKKISCGNEHVLMLTEPSGLVYSFGIGTRGQLGHGSIDNCYEPKLIENFINVKDIECGGWHSGLIDEDDNVYMWGWNSNGQLGLDEHEDETIMSIPSLINIFDENIGVKFLKISFGSRHSLLLDLNGKAYSVGWNKYNQLVLSTDEVDVRIPVLIQEFQNSVKDIKAGPWYSLILTF